LLLKHSALPMAEQKEIYKKSLSEWMGKNEQIDDVLLTGFRVG